MQMGNNNACCDASDPTPKLRPALSCADMLALRVQVYNDLLLAGQNVIEVEFGDQKVKYSAAQAPALLEDIKRLHRTCPSPQSMALLGLGDVGPIGVNFGCSPRPCGC